jgi:protein-disulfide isomerase
MAAPETQAAIVAHLESATDGAKTGDVTIVEFFDYNCPFCKKTHPELQKLLKSDQHVRVVYKELPVFGEVSEYAAKSALAAHWQGKYLLAHNTLIGAPNRLDATSDVDSILKKAGIDMMKLNDDRKRHTAEIDATVARSFEEARTLGLQGTPGFLIGLQIVPRSLTLPLFQQLIADARSTATKK